jgi:hypothetical protein
MRIGILCIAHLLLALEVFASSEKYSCGDTKKASRSYGKVEVRVDCELTEGRMWVAEFKGEVNHGFSQGFDRSTGLRKDSCFYINGQKTGKSMKWDSLGNVTLIAHYKNDQRIGKTEAFLRPGVHGVIKNYDSIGRQHGRQQEWWKNGQPKSDVMAREDQIISGTEYYPNGKPRIRYATVFDPARTTFSKKTIEQESWAPDGRSAGKVVKGLGEILLFSAEPEKDKIAAHKEIYKDSLMTHLDELDSAAVVKWLDVYSKRAKSAGK